MDGQYLIYGLAGIVALFLVAKLLKWPIKIIINGIIGVIILYAVNFILANLSLIGINVNFSLAINPITALIAGFFGVPGVIVLIMIGLFL
ncbi:MULTISPECIES: pro-sigmaK processing inhibitor BofA family protein [unclassified Clostridium]|uniref:pro-sigmaK processing inhibitor BofA family protein n=1 Tax=unclassified Clostridium TaxID=2614128 RepID=UPI0002978598|nr:MULTISPECIES: pro-sigmaK processing inhibitor BofA family protein [unclassified Clostridium]EKQ57864.1 MAG: SigmaK-factor processing regulatory protein BofA [Clostridium sp. Maddingley MBC34-26]